MSDQLSVTEQIQVYNEAADKIKAKFSNLKLLELTPQLLALHTIVRDAKTSNTDFVFYSDRIIRSLLEEALETLPYEEKEIKTPINHVYKGFELREPLCGVAMIRGGESMEAALRAVARDVSIGKLLVRDRDVVYCKAPSDLGQRRVLLMDAALASGTSALTAIGYLMRKYRVPEQNITLVTLISCEQGLQNLFAQYPNMQVVTTFLDPAISADNRLCLPGVGHYGSRYFGTDAEDHLAAEAYFAEDAPPSSPLPADQ